MTATTTMTMPKTEWSLALPPASSSTSAPSGTRAEPHRPSTTAVTTTAIGKNRSELSGRPSPIGASDSEEIYYGEQLAHTLEAFLDQIRLRDDVAIDPKDRHRLNHRCFAPGNPEPECPYCDYVDTTDSYRYLQSLVEGIRQDPRGRSHVVDHHPSPYTEDAFWLSLPKWQKLLGEDRIHWSIVTVRSMDRTSAREAFPARDGWDVRHVHGTALVEPQRNHLSAAGRRSPTASEQSTGPQTLLSDQPRLVAEHGRATALRRTGSDGRPPLVVRVFRCAPRECLKDGVVAVLAEDCPPNVFDLWIRHHEVPSLHGRDGRGDHRAAVDGCSGGPGDFGQFRHGLGAEVTLLELLTDVEAGPGGRSGPPCTPPATIGDANAIVGAPSRPIGRPSRDDFFPLCDAAYDGDIDVSAEGGDDDNASSTPPRYITVVTPSFPTPLTTWSTPHRTGSSPVSPALATASSSAPVSPLPSPPDAAALWGDEWPHLRPLPDPLLVRVLTDELDPFLASSFGGKSDPAEMWFDATSGRSPCVASDEANDENRPPSWSSRSAIKPPPRRPRRRARPPGRRPSALACWRKCL